MTNSESPKYGPPICGCPTDRPCEGLPGPSCPNIGRHFRSNPDGSAICLHRDMSVCSVCATLDELVEVAGVHYFVGGEDEREELKMLLTS